MPDRLGDAELELATNQAGLNSGLDAAQRKTNSWLGNVQQGFKKAHGKMLEGFGVGLGISVFNMASNAIAGVADAFVGTIQSAAEFERGMLNVQSITKGSAAELEAMGDTVLQMSGQFGQSAKTMAEGLYDISSSGFQGADAITVLDASARAATAGLSSTAVAAAGITAVLNAYGYGADQATRVSDVMFQTVNRGVVTFAELSAEIGKTTALASPLGVTIEEVGAAIAVMTRHGLDAADATTQLNAIMAAILKPSSEAAALAARLGIEWNTAGLKAKGLAGFLADMIEKTGGSEESMAILLGDVRAIRGAFALGADAGKELNTELGIMEEAGGATGDAFGIQSQGAAFKLAQAQAKLEAAGIEIGQRFLPILLKLVEFVTDELVPGLEGIASWLDIITGKLPENEAGWNGLIGTLNALNPLTWGQSHAFDELDQHARDAAAGVRIGGKGMTDEFNRLAEAGRDLGDEVYPGFDGIAVGAERAAKRVRLSAQSILTTIAELRAGLAGDAQAAADALYDPIIAAMDKAETEAELRGIRARLREKNLTADEVAELERRRAELGKVLITQTNDVLTYGTQAEQISKTKAFLASGFWAQAYRDAKPEQRLALDEWKTSLTERLLAMEQSAQTGGVATVDAYTGELSKGRPEVTTATSTMVHGADSPLAAAGNDARHAGREAGEAYAAGLRAREVQAAVSAAARALAQITSDYLRGKSPTKEGPMSEGGGLGGWGESAAESLAAGMLRRTRDVAQAARSVARAAVMGLDVEQAALAMPPIGALAARAMGSLTLGMAPAPALAPALLGAAPGGQRVVNENHVHVEGLTKARTPFEIAREMERFQRTGVLRSGYEDEEEG